jgi:hypothetical protein
MNYDSIISNLVRAIPAMTLNQTTRIVAGAANGLKVTSTGQPLPTNSTVRSFMVGRDTISDTDTWTLG